MDKRYQVFISSTFRDLQEERQAVLRAVLELDHMPAGMELFPAVDDAAWQLIQDVIDASDYYTLIIGGRYGSLDSTGIGYTEKEYDYASAQGKPVLAFLHANPNNLSRDKTETDAAAWKNLERFRKKIEGRHTCVYWNSSLELKSQVIVGITSATKRTPGVGWVRANKIPSEATVEEILLLRQRIAELEQQTAVDRLRPPEGSEDLLQGRERYTIKCDFKARDSEHLMHAWSTTISPTWDSTFAAVAPSMVDEASDAKLRRQFRAFFEDVAKRVLARDKDLTSEADDLAFPDTAITTCIVQFRALGLISTSVRKRSVKDTATYWTLTALGDEKMVQLRALRRTPEPPPIGTAARSSEKTEKTA